METILRRCSTLAAFAACAALTLGTIHCGGGGGGSGDGDRPGLTGECGDGTVDAGEQCDFAANNADTCQACLTPPDCCTNSCTRLTGCSGSPNPNPKPNPNPDPGATCGNGRTEGSEQCDMGAGNVPASQCGRCETCCTTSCRVVDNFTSDPSCQPEPEGQCNNGVREAGEECDQGAQNVDPSQCGACERCCSQSCRIIDNFSTDPGCGTN